MTNTTTTSYDDATTKALLDAARAHSTADEDAFLRMSDHALNFADDMIDAGN